MSARDLPTLITPTGTPLRRPSLREVAQVAGLLRPLAAADEEKGFVQTGMLVAAAPGWVKASRAPSPLETSLPGIFAAGDVRSGSVKRCATAVGEGGMVIAGVHEALVESK